MIQEWPEFWNTFEYWVQRKTRFLSTNKNRIWARLVPPNDKRFKITLNKLKFLKINEFQWILKNQWSSVSLNIRSILESWNSYLRSCLDYQNVKKKINFEELELPAYVNPCQPEERLWRFYLRFLAILQYDLANKHISYSDFSIRSETFKRVRSKLADFKVACKSDLFFGQNSQYTIEY